MPARAGAGGSHTTLIHNNKVRQYFDRGIVLEAGEGSPTFVATVTSNTVSNFADAIELAARHPLRLRHSWRPTTLRSRSMFATI